MSEPCRLRRGEGYEARSDARQEKAPALFCAVTVTPPRSAGRFRAGRQTLFLGLGSENNACLSKRAEKSHRCRISADAILKNGGFEHDRRKKSAHHLADR